MSDGQISYGDYAETTAKQVAEVVSDLPDGRSIKLREGVSVGRAQKYISSMELVLLNISGQVDRLVSSVDQFSTNAAGAIAAIRAADEAAEEMSRQYFVDVEKAEASSRVDSDGQDDSGSDGV